MRNNGQKHGLVVSTHLLELKDMDLSLQCVSWHVKSGGNQFDARWRSSGQWVKGERGEGQIMHLGGGTGNANMTE
jgi:hypothetical protein